MDAEVWNLNLDQIESHGGRVIEKIYVEAEKLGPSTFPFEARTVLYSKLRPYLNKVVVADEAGFATTELVPLRCNPDEVHPEYLAYFLRSEEFLRFATEVVAGAKMPRMVMTAFWDFQIPLPPLVEQRRIAAILNQADALRTKRREALAQLDSLTQSIFIEMFGSIESHENLWPKVELNGAAEVLTGYAFKSDEYIPQNNESIRLCRGANVLPGRIDWSDMACWKKSDAERILAFNLEIGDIVMAMDRPWISEGFKIARISSVDYPALLVQRVARIRAKANSLNDFLYAVLKQPAFTRHCKPTETTIPHISPKEIRTFTFGLPPVNLQREFSRRVSTVHQIRQNCVLSASHEDALFASLQYRAFRGEL